MRYDTHISKIRQNWNTRMHTRQMPSNI